MGGRILDLAPKVRQALPDMSLRRGPRPGAQCLLATGAAVGLVMLAGACGGSPKKAGSHATTTSAPPTATTTAATTTTAAGGTTAPTSPGGSTPSGQCNGASVAQQFTLNGTPISCGTAASQACDPTGAFNGFWARAFTWKGQSWQLSVTTPSSQSKQTLTVGGSTTQAQVSLSSGATTSGTGTGGTILTNPAGSVQFQNVSVSLPGKKVVINGQLSCGSSH